MNMYAATPELEQQHIITTTRAKIRAVFRAILILLREYIYLYVRMTSFIKSAKAVYDVESELEYVEIKYERFVRGRGYETYVDYINTYPLADWVSLTSESQSIPYEKFLDTMCEKTLEVRQKMAELALENIIADKRDVHTYIRTARAVTILDPTFQPPWINIKSAWQRDFMRKFCEDTLMDIIQRTTDESRLEYLFIVLRDIETEQ